MLRYFWPSDDEQLAGQWTDSHFDEDAGWWNTVQQCGAVFALAATLAITASSVAAGTATFSQAQDDPAGSLVLTQTVQEEYWQNPVPPVVWGQPAVFTDDVVPAQFVQVFTPDYGDWHSLIPPVADGNYLRLPFLDPDEIPVGSFPASTPVVDAQEPWAPQLPPYDYDWNVLFFLDDGSWVPAFQPDEDFWQQLVPAQNWPQPPQPFASSDEDNLVPQFPAEDVLWLQLVPPVPASLVWQQQWTFEQNESGNLISFAQEDYWQNPTPAVPDSLYFFPQWPFETNDPSGSLTLILDDAFRPDFVPAVPGSLVWPQQWTFEQNEPLGFLVPFHDEDFWTPQIPAVVWPQPSVFSSDEVVGQPSVSTVDEVYQSTLVASVPDSLFIHFPYLPDPEEIPAGSLVPPQPPPPPPLCPLPPSGPDADTSISTFSNFKGGPVLALFCRLCKSGKPLVVRGDYAIWCQDCCAFVSKQDTYMGTVQAPGQFRGRF